MLMPSALDRVSVEAWPGLEGRLKVMWLDSSGPAPSGDEATVADILSSCVEVASVGYARQSTSGHFVSGAGSSPRVLGADNMTWVAVAAGGEVLGAVLYLEETNDSDSPPLKWMPEFTGELLGSDVELLWSAAGVFRVEGA